MTLGGGAWNRRGAGTSGRELTNISYKFLDYIKTFFKGKFPISEQKSIVFGKKENVIHTMGAGGYAPDTGGSGV